jgi:HD-like signal output (HDOD) protein
MRSSTSSQPAIQVPGNVTEINFQTDQVTIPVKLCNLPPFNAIATQVLSLTADPDIDLSHLSKVIEADPAFAADILFLANSSLFGFPSRMYILRHAISVLGLDRIKALALTVAMRGFVGARNQLVHQCWQHSVACAMVCEELSAIFGFSGDRAYTAGIMHDIGRLGFLKAYPKETTSILSCGHVDTQAVLRAEREELNVDHGCAGSWLVSNWAFPKDFSEICLHHHDAPKANDSHVLQLVKVACNVADIIGFPAVRCQQQPSYLIATSRLPLRGGRDMVPPVGDLRANVTARLAAFENCSYAVVAPTRPNICSMPFPPR